MSRPRHRHRQGHHLTLTRSSTRRDPRRRHSACHERRTLLLLGGCCSNYNNYYCSNYINITLYVTFVPTYDTCIVVCGLKCVFLILGASDSFARSPSSQGTGTPALASCRTSRVVVNTIQARGSITAYSDRTASLLVCEIRAAEANY